MAQAFSLKIVSESEDGLTGHVSFDIRAVMRDDATGEDREGYVETVGIDAATLFSKYGGDRQAYLVQQHKDRMIQMLRDKLANEANKVDLAGKEL